MQASDGMYTDKVRVTWNATAGAISYNVYRATSLTGSKTLLGSPTVSPYNDTTAVPGRQYYYCYWMKAKNSLGSSGNSSSNGGWRSL